jgi:diaphanous 1
MKNWFWTKVKFLSEESYKASLWSNIDDTKIKLDVASLEASFGVRKAKKKNDSTKQSSATSHKKKEKISIVDGKRQQNCGIALKRFRMPFSKLKDIIVQCDSNQLTAEMCSSLLRIVPTTEEVALVKDYEGSPSDLMETEQFFLEVGNVPRISQRLNCVLTTFTFSDNLEAVRTKQKEVQAALSALQNSEHFRNVVTVVLAIGNYLNGGTKKGGAHGFALKDLEKLLQVKTTDNKGTLMHYLANYLTNERPELCNFMNDLKPVMTCCIIDVGELLKDYNGQKKKLNELKKETEQSTGIGSENFKRRMKLFITDAETLLSATEKEYTILNLALKQQIVGWGEKEPKPGASPDPSSTFFTQLANFCKAYKRAADENKRKKDMLAKKARQEAEKAKRAADRKSKKKEQQGGAAKEDIFDAFDQKMKGGNAANIISEFKNRHKKGRAGSRSRVSNMGKDNKVGGAMRSELAAVLGRRR